MPSIFSAAAPPLWPARFTPPPLDTIGMHVVKSEYFPIRYEQDNVVAKTAYIISDAIVMEFHTTKVFFFGGAVAGGLLVGAGTAWGGWEACICIQGSGFERGLF